MRMKRSTLLIALLCGVTFGHAQQARIYTTTADRTLQLKQAKVKTTKEAEDGIQLLINPATTYQTMDGFGYAITYSTAYNLMQMKAKDRRDFLIKTFSPTKGYGCSYVRISIGCSDFSSTEYTLCDKPGIENFQLRSDELNYVIPILKEILAINPNLKIIGSPWTCPKWMKVKDLDSTEPYDSWTGGRLNPNCREDYATYFVKFVQAFQAHDIAIYAVTPQNEPLHSGNCASLYMTWEEQTAFIRHLAPAFAHAGLQTKIYAFDHNFNYDNIKSQVDYPLHIFNALDADMPGINLVAGSAWHNYGGTPDMLETIHAQAPDKEIIFTESSIGEWSKGRDLSVRLLPEINHLLLACVNRHCRAVIVWNMMLDLRYGPYIDGGCNTCFGAVDIDEKDYRTITRNSQYFMISHASAVIRPGAVRVGSTLNASEETKRASRLSHTACQNTDGSVGVIVSNDSKQEQVVQVVVPTVGCYPITLPAKSVVSVLVPAKK
ncbi:MAG: glucosylceramidase [Bacteroidaceae bacterium]|nr:glucosylceramidase [Bacteroidaceae bacterium]